MKIVYIAHPISAETSSFTVYENIQKVLDIVRMINLTDSEIVPFAHYIVDCYAMNDSDPFERQRGIKNDEALFKAGFINELWLYGDNISPGMHAEIKLAYKLGIPVIPKSENTLREFNSEYV